MFDPNKPRCEVCRRNYRRWKTEADKKGERYDPGKYEPPCDKCLPALMPENEDSWRIYCIVSSQYIMGPFGPVEIEQTAVWKAIDEYEIKNRLRVFEDVIMIAHINIESTEKKDG